jgi:tRNA(fMet)-specific endonuclease VapC
MPAVRYLLDTNVLSDLIRHPQGPVAQRLLQCPADTAGTSLVVAAELRYGAERKGSAVLTQRVQQLLQQLPVWALEPDADAHYAAVRHHLERAGQPIGANDLLIAAHALALGATLVTNNRREFDRVPGLRVEDWLEARPAA